MNVEVWCDGSSSGNSTGPGGWGYVILVEGAVVRECNGHMPVATNNTAEITAACEGMAWLLSQGNIQPTSVVLVSDSQLVLRYADGQYRCKQPHLVPYYVRLRKLYAQTKATTRWVKGHAGNEINESCDRLAKAGKDGITIENTYALPTTVESEVV